jgi:thiosulfate dehydrogenase [quinone] large subunit
LLAVVDIVNSWGLLLIGLGLMLGCLTRSATVAGMVLLLLYYIAAPPFVGYQYTLPAEGSYLIVNKVLIELVALAVLFTFPTGKLFGLDKLLPWKTNPTHKALKRAHA